MNMLHEQIIVEIIELMKYILLQNHERNESNK